MKGKLNNLIDFSDFTSNWRTEKAKKTDRTETGLDVLAHNGSHAQDVEKGHASDNSKTVSNGLSKKVV